MCVCVCVCQCLGNLPIDTMDVETTLLIKPEVHVYQIPPRTSAKGYRASDWNLTEPMWTGRLRMTARGRTCNIRLEDRDTQQLFANCPIETFPGVAVEAVTDSSRYFVLRVVSDNDRTAFLGIGFSDRSDSFDLNVTLQDHFKWVQKDNELEQSGASGQPALDLGFKDGQTIKINMKITKKRQENEDGEEDDSKSRHNKPPSSSSSTAPARGFLGAAPGGGLLPPPPSVSSANRVSSQPNDTKPASTQPSSGWVQF